MKYLISIAVLFMFMLSGCSESTTSGPTSTGTVYLWIGADKDTWVWYESPDVSWGQDGYMRVAYANDTKKSFVHFPIPSLPEGTTIEEAYLELYHGGKNEDGQTDDLEIDVQRVYEEWSPSTLTWNNQPAFTNAAEFTIDLQSQAWSASDDIVTIVREIFDDPDSFEGFQVFWLKNTGMNIEKGFHSNNNDRTPTDMKHAPRLLVKITLPDGKTTDDITLPPLITDNDLDFEAGTEILMLRYASGSSWPDSWEVVHDN